MTPVRSCVGCGRRAPQRELVRFAARAGTLVHDPARRVGGRGAYVCPRAACFERACARRGFARVLRTPVDVPAELLTLFQEG